MPEKLLAQLETEIADTEHRLQTVRDPRQKRQLQAAIQRLKEELARQKGQL